MRRGLFIFLIIVAGITSIELKMTAGIAAHLSPQKPQTPKIGKLVIPRSDCWLRVGETIDLNTQAFDESDQLITPTPTLQYVIRRAPDGALGGGRPELVSVDASAHTITGLQSGVTAICAIDPSVTERGQVKSNELTITVLPPAPTPSPSPEILVAGYIKVNGSYFGNDTEVTLTSPSGQVERLTAASDGYFHFGWGNHIGKILTAKLAGYNFESLTIDGREYYIINGTPGSGQ
jgi:hypothetical protein